MILGRGTADTDEAIIAEYQRFLADAPHIHNDNVRKRLCEGPLVMARGIGKSLSAWTDADILTLYHSRRKTSWHIYNTFLSFLFFRGYRQATLPLLGALKSDLSRHWRSYLQPYREKIERTRKELDYLSESTTSLLNLLLWVLVLTHKPLEELTRADFEQFREHYHSWYLQQQHRTTERPNPRLFKLERFLIQWGIFPPERRVFRHEQHFDSLQQETFRQTILHYMQWCDVRYQPSTIDSARAALLAFFLWLQASDPTCARLDEVTRSIALAYGQYLKQQVEVGRYGEVYQRGLHTYIRQFFDFAIDEGLETSPSRNPFSVRDLPRAPDMLPRYLTDQELRAVLRYCEQEATLFERTAVITLLHTGIRAMEFAQLKASDIVQIGGVWKLHIHLGKGLKDRLIPLTAQCLTVLQTWQGQGWERISDHLFTKHGRPWRTSGAVTEAVRKIGLKVGVPGLTAHRFRHSFAVALLNYGMRESALQKLMGHATLGMTLEYARILDQTVEHAFSTAVEHMQEGPHSWVPNFFVQEDYTRFVEGDAVSWIRLPLGYCRRNPKLHCESDVKCLLCDRFAAGREDMPRLKLMHERFLKLGLGLKADVVAAQIQRLEVPTGDGPQGFIPIQAISTTPRRSESNTLLSR
jgi:site-specific recombinase XerD